MKLLFSLYVNGFGAIENPCKFMGLSLSSIGEGAGVSHRCLDRGNSQRFRNRLSSSPD